MAPKQTGGACTTRHSLIGFFSCFAAKILPEAKKHPCTSTPNESHPKKSWQDKEKLLIIR
ncbi:hypothetical protein PT7_1265 [Pusillimonas sp. T7-7]|nr:hypothetical protein PT7_1265 [Pusillimonas sp. T7-7]